MTQDALEERVENCLEIARKLWPDVAAYLTLSAGAEDAVWRIAGGTVLIDINQHPRALDAMEQALQTLHGNGEEAERLPEGIVGEAIYVLRRSWWMDDVGAVRRMLRAVLSHPSFKADARALRQSEDE